MASSVMRELVTGKGAHADAFASVEGIPLEVAGARVTGFPQTIFGLVWHAAYWMDYEARRIAGEAPPYPEHAEASWPGRPAPQDEAEWAMAMSWFKKGIVQLLAFADLPAPHLGRKVPRTHESSNQADVLQDVVWQTLVHNSYHVGQIVLLRQALGAWPPPRGRDTW
jgi:uncharacterized damage-inducible protein DinB